MSADYRVDLTIGPTVDGTTYSWSINKGDPPSLPEIVDGLEVAWQFPEASLWPVQPEPQVATFGIVAASAADLVGIDRGTPVLLRVWAGLTIDGVDYDSITFPGRIAEANGRAVRIVDPATDELVNGWMLDVSCVDLTADLGEPTVAGKIPFQGLSVLGHVGETFELAGLEYPDFGDGGAGAFLLIDSPTQGLVEPATLAEHVETILSCYADGGAVGIAWDEDPAAYALYDEQGWRRGIIRPNVDDDGVLLANPWRIEWVSRRHGLQPGIGPGLPLRFVDLGAGSYGLRLEAPPASVVIGGTTIPVYDAAIVVDADYLERQPASWSRSKFDDPNTIDVALDTARYPEIAGQSADWTSVRVSSRVAGEPVVAGQLTGSRLGLSYMAQRVGEMYVDDSSNAGVIWSAGGLTWLASEDPSWPRARSLFPDTALFGEYGAPIVVTGIPETQRPDARDWYTGVPRSVAWRFSRGRFSISFDLYPRIPRPMNAASIGLTWAELDSDHPAVTWPALDPSFAWLDYRLARSTLYDP